MHLTTVQDPTRVDATASDSLLMAIDRGNSGTKIAVSVNGIPLSPFKIPSVIRSVDTDGVIEVSGKHYVCGDAAIGMTQGTVSTPLRTGDKVAGLSIVIAQAIQKISETRPLSSDIEMRLTVSSPFSSDALVTQIKSEIMTLCTGFTVNGKTYRATVSSVSTAFEGAVLLESERKFNGLIDIGFGTILAAYRGASSKVAIAPVMGGDLGGCNLVLNGLLNDPSFLAAVKKSGASAPPSAERLSSRLSEGVTTLRGIDLKPLLKTHLKVLKTRIEDAAVSVKTELRLSTEDYDLIPKIALVGGGAALMRMLLSQDQIDSWSKKNSIELIDQPDFQTAMAMHQIAHMGGSL
ncbi:MULTISPECIES: ParM/StbA family protein [Leptolyngbya]|uniref:ParM/StbA family protein n=1 Tax=Leptolyngbya TaxID=47251 RepID=UPI001687D3AC|nr:hypothetical protein [Leptolyngbya sp. FACHB-1624]MBD1857440.1 hypothetical protein [Leptolyngbya sp. FACHB-1624]